MATASVFGVYFGFSSSCIAGSRVDGKAEVIANDLGDRVTPTVVSYTEYEKTVGVSAKQSINHNLANTVFGVKWLLGKPFDHSDVKNAVEAQHVQIIEKNGYPVYNVTFKEKLQSFSPVEVTSTIYEKLHETATSLAGNSDAHDVVLTVPLYFSSAQHKAMRTAATAAGFNVLRVIHEPSAALLAYGIGQDHSAEALNVIVYQHGGETLDVAVMQSIAGLYVVVASSHQRNIGGNVIDSIIVENFASEFERQKKVNCRGNKRSMNKLRTAAENCKKTLSTLQTTQCTVDSLCEGIDFNVSLSRSRLEGLCAGFIQKCLEPVCDVLKTAKLTKESIDKVVMCGGTAKMPLIQQQIREQFPDADILTSIPADEVIAIGAAVQASLMPEIIPCDTEQEQSVTKTVPCVSGDIVLQVNSEGVEYLDLVCKGTAIPVRRQKKFVVMSTNNSVCMQIMQRIYDESANLKPIAKINLVELTEVCNMIVSLHIRLDGSLHITCTESISGKSKSAVTECGSA